jgi:hypothetical protein
MASDYLKDLDTRADKKSGGFHLTHKATGHSVSLLPNKRTNQYELRHGGKLISSHPTSGAALQATADYFKTNHKGKYHPASVNFSSSPKTLKSESLSKSDYFRNKLSQVTGVHKPYMSSGTSMAGEMNREAKAKNSPIHADVARKIHGQKLKEIMGIKPNLPKKELGKAAPQSYQPKGVHLPDPTTGKTKPQMALATGFDFGAKEEHKSKLKELKGMQKPSLPKSELNKARVDDGKPVFDKINDRSARYFRDRLQNVKGQFAKESIQNKAPATQMEYASTPKTSEAIRSQANMIHNNTMSHLTATKPKLPKTEIK